MKTENKNNRIKKLIAFLKTLPQKHSKPEPADYSSWDQTEAEYQKEQAEWLEKVARQKNRKMKKPEKPKKETIGKHKQK